MNTTYRPLYLIISCLLFTNHCMQYVRYVSLVYPFGRVVSTLLVLMLKTYMWLHLNVYVMFVLLWFLVQYLLSLNYNQLFHLIDTLLP